MRWRPFTWLLLSVLFFVAAAFFWRLGDDWAARKTAPGTAPATNQAKPLRPQDHPAAQAAPINVRSESGNLNASGLAAKTNGVPDRRFPYRLSNTQRPLRELVHRDKAILLQNALIDTEQPAGLPIPDALKARGEPGSYIVQSRTPLDNNFRALLKEAGAEIVSFVPNNAYLVLASAAAARQLATDPQTQTVLPYEPYYKLQPGLLKLAIEQTPLPENTTLNLLLFPGARAEINSALQTRQVQVVREDHSPFGPVLSVRAPSGAETLPDLAALTGVQGIELAHVRVPANDLSRAELGVATNSVTTNNYLGLTGSNIVVNVNDTGIDATHPDFAGGRIFGNSPLSVVDPDGHGTHVAGIIGGSGLMSTNVNNAFGSIMPPSPLQFRGKAPDARLFSVNFDPVNGPFVPDSFLQETAARTNAFISNNSWNYGATAEYDLAAASYDAAVRDALPRVTGSQPVLFVFSAGNEGGGSDDGTGGSGDTIDSPATAKNVITVGAIELPRNITNTVVSDCVTVTTNATNTITICTTNTPWATLTDSSDQVASFSSRGNVGIGIEGDSGRFKPDVVAPGTFVVSTRSQQWNEQAYYSRHETFIYRYITLGVSDFNFFSTPIFLPDNATAFSLTVLPNESSPTPFPGIPIYVKKDDFPTPTTFDFLGTNQLTIAGSALTPLDQVWFFGVGNSTTQRVVFDLRADITFSNANDTLYFQVLSNLNNSLETNGTAHFYRYESGTSMAAADASGVLALMQDMLQNRLGHVNPAGRFTNSPALLKALLINGARSVGNLYDFSTTNTINFQGWGLINLSNSVPGGLATPGAATNSMFLYDQGPVNALATGQSHTRTFQVSPDAQGQPLRFTLVWTDPPGNPNASTKLVNDLDLIVTNLDTGDIFFGNDILPGNDVNLPWDTNQPPNIDAINNVENVYLSPVGGRYSVTVVGRRVNVNAVTANPDNVAQDYALVVSSGDGALTNALSFVGEVDTAASVPLVTVITNTFGGGRDFGAILSRQHVGANSPLLGTNNILYPTDANAVITLGQTAQWHFYAIVNTNGADFTNAAFASFAPPNLAVPVMGVRNLEEGTNSTRAEADIDLYVSRDLRLTNLFPLALSGALKAVGRGGTESIIISNAIPGRTYYIAVKSEDQRAAEYSLLALFSNQPFSTTDTNGNPTLRGVPAPAPIPDGSPFQPGAATILAFSPNPSMLLHRVIVTNFITHQLMGDLFGALTHQGDQLFAVLNNHSIDSAVTNAEFIYDDSSEANVPGAQHTDGPGSLHDFAGKASGQQWKFTMIDNAQNHVGTNNSFWIFLEKQQDLTNGITAGLNPGACREDFQLVPADATNLTVTVGLLSGTGPISFEVCPVNGTPGQCKSNLITSAGRIISIDKNDVPPLSAGEYVVRLCNLGPDAVTVHIVAELDIGVGVPVERQFTLTNPVPILDDAVTTITNTITNHFEIASLDVGLLINHPRVSDLAITLISPGGTRIVLFENRGALSTNGLGTFSQTTDNLGLPVFAVTNLTPFYSNDFEQAPVGLYLPGATFQDWNVLTNSVTVVRDLTDLCLNNNVLVLGDGIISNSLPTTNSTFYHLDFKVTHSPYLIGMVGWWPLDEDAMDFFGHDGLLCGDPQFVAGEVLGSYQGDGVGTSVTVPRCPDLDVGQGRGFTIEGWINPANTNAANAAPLVEWNNAANTNAQGVQFWYSGLVGLPAPGALVANIRDANSQPHIVSTPNNSITNGGWQHVALSYDAGASIARIYTNGQLAVLQSVAPGFVPRTSGDLYFGYHGAPTTDGTVAFQGGLDEFTLYNRALCDCEIAAIAGVGSRGKYGTNVLICPVTNTVQIGSILTTNFINGTNWSVTGPQWEVNSIDFENPLLFAGTNGPATNVTPIIITPVGCPGAALDDFVLSSQVTNFFDTLLHFTDDANIAPVPIKFAPAPYTVQNFPPTLVFTNGFENATLGVVPIGGVVPGSANSVAVGQRNWTVVNGPIAVVTNANREGVSSNFLALAAGGVQCPLPTIPGHRYQVTYSVRGPCAAGWWNGDLDPLSRRALDLIGDNNGAFIGGATNTLLRYVGNDGLFFPGMIATNPPGIPDRASKIELGDPDNLKFTNALTIEGWIRPILQTNQAMIDLAASSEESAIEQIFFRGDSRRCLDPYYLALEQSDPSTFGLLFHIEGNNRGDCGLTLEAEGVVPVNQWHHVAGVFESNVLWTNNPPWPTNQLRLYVDGQRLTNIIIHPFPEGALVDGFTGLSPFHDLDPGFSPGVAIGNRSRSDASEPFRGFMDELSVYARALTDPEIAAIFATGRVGKFDRVVPPASSLAKLSVQIDGDQKDVGYGDNSRWTTHAFSFIALSTNAMLTLQSLLPGTEVDTVLLTELPTELNYQPEEALSQLNGQDAFGQWRLEIWDNRAGATNNNPELLDWQLTFHLQPSNPPPVLSLSHCVPSINTVAPGGVQYFVVEVPQWATMATNTLEFVLERFTTNPQPVTVLFNQNNFPGPGDLALIGPSVSSGSTLLSNNITSIPQLVPGQPYFLAVTNPNSVAVTFSIDVCYDIATLTNCQPATTFSVGTAGIPRYFQFDVPNNTVPPDSPQAATIWLTGANSNLTVVLSQQLPLPDLEHYDYISDRPCTNDEILMVVTNSTPFPIQTNRWYVGVFNTKPTDVPFTIQACYSTNYPTLVPLTNAVPFVVKPGDAFEAPPGPPRFLFYQFSVTNPVDRILFELYNLSGDADLVLQKDVPPGQEPYFDGSFRTGNNPEQIVVRTGFNLPDLRGDWFLGVYNNEANKVDYTIRAVTPNTNGLLVSALPLGLTISPLAPPHGLLLQWNSVVGETYIIQVSSTLPANWITVSPPIVATTPCANYELPPSTTGFVRVLQLPPQPVVQPTLTILFVPPNQLRISWPSSFTGFTLQSAPSPVGPWTDVGLPVTVIGAEFVVFDTLGPGAKFYRLIK